MTAEELETNEAPLMRNSKLRRERKMVNYGRFSWDKAHFTEQKWGDRA